MIPSDTIPRDPCAAEAAERLAYTARRAFKRAHDMRRLAMIAIAALGELADVTAVRRAGKAVQALQRHADLLTQIAEAGTSRSSRRPPPRPRHHLLAEHEVPTHEDE